MSLYRRRIVIVGPFALYPKGTVLVRIVPLAQALSRLGHNIRVILPPYDNKGHSGRNLTFEGVEIENIQMSYLPVFGYVISTLRLAMHVLKRKPSLIHIFKPKGYSGLAAMFFIILKRFKVLDIKLVVDSDDWEGIHGFGEYFSRLYSRLVAYFFHCQEQWISRRSDAITVASRTLQRRAIHEFRIPANKVFYVPNGHNGKRYSFDSSRVRQLRKLLGIDESFVIALYTRFLEFDIAKPVRILGIVSKKITDVKLLVIGKGFFREEEIFLRLVKKAGLTSNLVYVGWLKPEEVPEYLATADVAIYPYDDNILNRSKCPGKIVELLELGKPVVAEDVGEISTYVKDGFSGLLVRPGDIEGLASRVIQVATSPLLRQKLEEGARTLIDKFNWRYLVRHVENSYTYALDAHIRKRDPNSVVSG
jgi:glycosyltransferase involved in cell wall biosynthesis